MLSICRNTSRRTVNGFWKYLYNGTVYVDFRVCFAMAMYEKDMFLLFETPNAFIGAFCYSKKVVAYCCMKVVQKTPGITFIQK